MDTTLSMLETFEVVNHPIRFTNLYNFQLELDKNYKKEIYVDSADFISLILGIHDFYSNIELNEPLFDNFKFGRKMTMLHSLIYNEYLGQVRLLSPHMFEYLEKNLSQNYYFKRPLSIKDGESIIHNFKLFNLSPDEMQNRSIEELLPFDLIESEAETRFKLMYLIREGVPQKRASRLLKTGVLSFETDPDFNLTKYTSTKLFKRLLDNLNEVYQTRRNINNFHDALALCQLQAKFVEHLKADHPKGEKTTIPLLYMHKKVVEAVRRVSEDRDLMEDGKAPFVFEGQKGNYLIVQDEDFFLLDALFNVRAKDSDGFTFEDFFEEIQDVYNELNRPSADVHLERLANIELSEKEAFKESFKKRVELAFFRKWWEGGNGQLDLIQTLHELNAIDKATLEGESFDYVEEELELSQKELESKARQLTLSLKLAKKIFHKKFMESISAKHDDAGRLKYNLEQEFITRFSYQMEHVQAIRKFIQRLNESNKEDRYKTNEELRIEIIDYLQYVMDYQVLRSDRNEVGTNRLNNLIVMLSILWMEGEYELLNQHCEVITQTLRSVDSGNDGYPNYQIGLLHATSLIQQAEVSGVVEYDKIMEILKCIDSKFSHHTHKYNCRIGQSFVYSKLWESVDSKISIPEIMALKPLSTTDEQKRRGYYQHSKALALDAFKEVTDVLRDDTKRDDEKKHVRERRYYYSMNLYIYMETLNRQLAEFPGDLAKMVRDLEGLTNSNLQHERYYDTLARYYQRMAAKMAVESPESPDKYEGYLTNAMHFVENAIQSARENNNRTDIDLYEPLRNELANMRLEGVRYFNN